MWTWHQKKGQLVNDAGEVIASGYSGHGEGVNNPEMETVQAVGPIPAGKWKIERWDAHHSHLGPVVAVLVPVDHDAHGRSAFRIHGDNSKMNHTASNGCIVLSRAAREAWRDNGGSEFEVVA